MSGGYSYLFGPVRSRRLGRSLGIDLVPHKVCTYDCPYCQVGATTDKTLERREYVPVAAVLAEFDLWRERDGQADCVTLAGGGEPTLHSRFGEVIEAVGTRSGLRRILLSNGSLFSLPEVRAAAAKAEVVKATLSAWDSESYQALHHPHAALGFETFIGGLKAMREAFQGEYWLEVFVVPGLNDRPEQIARIAKLASVIGPDRIHLNTAVRPARDGGILPVDGAGLQALSRLFNPVAEVIGAPPPASAPGVLRGEDLDARIVSLIQRHPCTAADIAVAMGVTPGEVEQPLAGLVESGVLRLEKRGSGSFYIWALSQ